jgi:hypothetical protein
MAIGSWEIAAWRHGRWIPEAILRESTSMGPRTLVRPKAFDDADDAKALLFPSPVLGRATALAPCERVA